MELHLSCKGSIVQLQLRLLYNLTEIAGARHAVNFTNYTYKTQNLNLVRIVSVCWVKSACEGIMRSLNKHVNQSNGAFCFSRNSLTLIVTNMGIWMIGAVV